MPAWYDLGRRCCSCAAVSYRPPGSTAPCSWCGGELREETPEETAARRQHYHDLARERGQRA